MVVATKDPTCNSSRYDFFIVSKDLDESNSVAGIVRMTDGGNNPHYPARLLLRGDCKRKMVRTLNRPTKVPGVLPRGPLPKQGNWEVDAEAERDADNAMKKWYGRARNCLRSLCVDGKPNKLIVAETVWKPAIGKPAKQHAGSAWKSDAWRVLSGRFTEVAQLLHRAVHTHEADALIHHHIVKSHKLAKGAKKEQDDRHLLMAWVETAEVAAARGNADQVGALVQVAVRKRITKA